MSTNAQQYRHEFKYVVSAAQIPLLRSRISSFMSPDPHAGSAGDYEIRSLYFDDYHNRCFYENENGTDPREKFRIRIYNHSDSPVTLECKRKEHGKTLKTACSLLPGQAESLMRNLPLPESEPVSPLLRKLDLLRQTAPETGAELDKRLARYEQVLKNSFPALCAEGEKGTDFIPVDSIFLHSL